MTLAFVAVLTPRGGEDFLVGDAVEDIRSGVLVASLRMAGHNTVWFDAALEGWSADQAVRAIRASRASLVVVHAMYRTLGYSLEVAGQLRWQDPDLPILFHGLAATLSWREVLRDAPAVDGILLGEPEESCLDLLQTPREHWERLPGVAVRGSVPSRRRGSRDLDQLPVPARDFLPRYRGLNPTAQLMTSRGCRGRCSFCSLPAFLGYQSWRGRSPEGVVEEVQGIHAASGIRDFQVVDDNFMGPGRSGRERARRFAREVRDRHLRIRFSIFCRPDDFEPELFAELRGAGLRAVNLGIEFPSERMLRRFRKDLALEDLVRAITGLRQLGIRPVPSAIMFEPTVRLEEIRAAVAFALQHRLDSLVAPTRLIPFPGTRLVELLHAERLVAPDAFMFPPYIPAVRFQDTRVAELQESWDRWHRDIDGWYGRLRTLLGRAALLLGERREVLRPRAAWRDLERLHGRFKRLEIREVNTMCEDLANGRKPSPSILHAEFEALSRGVSSVLAGSDRVAAQLGATAVTAPAGKGGGTDG